MSLKKMTTKSTADYSEQINKLASEFETADAILIGAGAGLSTAAGFYYNGDRFETYFSDWKNIGHGGHETLLSIGTTPRWANHMPTYWNL